MSRTNFCKVTTKGYRAVSLLLYLPISFFFMQLIQSDLFTLSIDKITGVMYNITINLEQQKQIGKEA